MYNITQKEVKTVIREKTKQFIHRSILIEEPVFYKFKSLLDKKENFNKVVNSLIRDEIIYREEIKKPI